MTLTVGRESSEDEIAAVSEAFEPYGVEVRPNLYRASTELPMTIMIGLATGIVGNALYEVLKTAFLAVTDKRMKRRNTYAIIQQEEYEYGVKKGSFFVRKRSTYEAVEFKSLEEMIEYLEKRSSGKTKN